MGEYTAGDDLMQMCYAFEFLAADQPSAARVAEVMGRVDTNAADGWACWAFSNHDVQRHTSRWNLTPSAQKLLCTLMMCLKGSVCLYQGEELGLPEAELNFEDLQDPYGIEFWPEFKGRDGCRTPMVWEPSNQNAGFSAAKPWLPVPAEHLNRCVANQENEPGAMLQHYRHAIAFRRNMPALQRGTHDGVKHDGDVVYFTRSHGDQTVFCAFNMSDTPSDFDLPEGNWRPLGNELGCAHVSADGKLHFGPWQPFIGMLREGSGT